MPLQFRYTSFIAWHVFIAEYSFIVQEWGILSYRDLNKFYFTWQKHGIIWEIYLTHKK